MEIDVETTLLHIILYSVLLYAKLELPTVYADLDFSTQSI